MLDVRALAPVKGADLFDARAVSTRIVPGDGREHVRIDHDDGVVRFDVIEGTMRSGSVVLRFDLPRDARLGARLDAVHVACAVLTGQSAPGIVSAWLHEALLALHAHDARTVGGTSLRDIADDLLGVGDWPGDGEHRKSRARRLVQIGMELIRDGPQGVFQRFAGRRLTARSSASGAVRPRDSVPARPDGRR